MYGIFTIFSIILLPVTTFLLSIGCANKDKSPPKENRMPGSTTPGTPTPPTSTPATNTPISSKQAEASKQMSEGAMNWSAMKLASKEECEKTNLDEYEEVNLFDGKYGKLKAAEKAKTGEVEKKKSLKGSKRIYKSYKSNKKNPPPSPQAASLEPTPPTPQVGKQTEEKGEVTQGTVMRTVNPAGQTQGSIMPTVAVPVRKKGSVMKTVNQTIDATSVLEETPRSQPANPLRSRQSLTKELNVELSLNNNNIEKVTQYNKVLPSRIHPTQMLPPTASAPVPAKAHASKERISAKKAPGVPAVKKGVKSKKSERKMSTRKVTVCAKKNKSKEKCTEGTTSEEQEHQKSLDSTPTQSDTHIIPADSCIHPAPHLPPAALPPGPPVTGKDTGKVAPVVNKDGQVKEAAANSVQFGALSLYMKP